MTNTYSFFLGANSPRGFYSCYASLIDLESAAEVLVIKAPPGGGKSGFMRRVASKLIEAGAEVEYIYCSSDPGSLDGVVFPEIGVAIVDGTSPHVVEPSYPYAVDRYLNLGAYVDHRSLERLSGEVRRAITAYREPYEDAYRCLRAAAYAAESADQLLWSEDAEAHALKRAAGIAKREFRRRGGTRGKEKLRFLSGFTPQGYYVHKKTPAALCDRIYEIDDDCGIAHAMLAYLRGAALDAGLDVISCFDPLAPEKLAHLFIPEERLGFVRGQFGEPFRRVRLSAYADPEQRASCRGRVRLLRKMSAELIDDACAYFAEAKRRHDLLEEIYNPYVDFESLYAFAEQTAAEIADRLNR